VIYHSKSELVAITNGPFDKKQGLAPQIEEVVVKYKVVPA
jgi:hypothetical protein